MGEGESREPYKKEPTRLLSLTLALIELDFNRSVNGSVTALTIPLEKQIAK